jgi:hypothetical protein
MPNDGLTPGRSPRRASLAFPVASTAFVAGTTSVCLFFGHIACHAVELPNALKPASAQQPFAEVQVGRELCAVKAHLCPEPVLMIPMVVLDFLGGVMTTCACSQPRTITLDRTARSPSSFAAKSRRCSRKTATPVLGWSGRRSRARIRLGRSIRSGAKSRTESSPRSTQRMECRPICPGSSPTSLRKTRQPMAKVKRE